MNPRLAKRRMAWRHAKSKDWRLREWRGPTSSMDSQLSGNRCRLPLTGTLSLCHEREIAGHVVLAIPDNSLPQVRQGRVLA